MAYPRLFKKGKTHKLTNTEILKAQELYQSGWTLKEVAEEFGVSDTAIHYHVNEKSNERVKTQALRFANKDKKLSLLRNKLNRRSKYYRQRKECIAYFNGLKKIRNLLTSQASKDEGIKEIRKGDV